MMNGIERMAKTVKQFRDEMADREAIRDCLYRYCRGADRCDADLLRSVYWPGAMDYHTGFAGTAEEFIEWGLPRMQALEQFHMLGNILIRLDGDSAVVESYLFSLSITRGDEAKRVMVCGRYLDRFEKRHDEWRISERTVVHDWFDEAANAADWSVGPFGMSGLLRGATKPDDTSYTSLGLQADE